ncbi:HAMP domain-containing sensor histidine kinase [Sphingomonas immobilis]|uniref:histidine kinase n=1 Tax=Sphingomonas immobilis TaxID=3063997 RepID=A0ABT8ZXA9_9SPHN|nr:HAMP domain-containing sensor histidine kinase [Sphingomonas sp. CA1-15]MDO7841862.1 HAMP domain-containing sensor histidine kinase [Sphingomonas sp. CA1-15]
MSNIWASSAYRIAFTYSAGFAIMIAGLGTMVYFAADANFRGQQDASISAESDELVHEFRSGGMPELRANIDRRERDSVADGFGYAVFGLNGRRVAGHLDTPRPDVGWQTLVFKDPEEGRDEARAQVTSLSPDRTLVVALDSEAVEQLDGTILALFAGALLLMLVFGTGGAFLLGGFLRTRLEQITGTAEAILAGDLQRRVPSRPGDNEFDRVGRSLNAMLDRIADLMENLRQVSTDVAHDLRTPLSRMRSEIDEALEGPMDPILQHLALRKALTQSDELLSLFSAILRISEIEGGAAARSFEPIDLAALAEDLCTSFLPVVEDGYRNLSWATNPNIWVLGDRELLSQAIVNLLENAQVHTPPGTRIHVEVVACGDRAGISVQDDGPGVPPEDFARITRRFVRLDESRSTDGHGLGLNLVSAIAGIHRGTLSIDSAEPGLRIVIDLPLASALSDGA